MSLGASDHLGEYAEFRGRVAHWLAEHCPASLRGQDGKTAGGLWGGRQRDPNGTPAWRWLDAMAAQGWIAPAWPVAYGGAGYSADEVTILREEMRKAGAPDPLASPNIGLNMLGPVLLEFGDAAQRKRYLPGIAGGSVRWCQGFSEPLAGSDLAALSTRAERDGDIYVVNGHKIWSSYAHLSDWMFCLVRTDPAAPKREGICFLLIDLDSPGVRIAPIELISGESLFCEVLLSDVRVPVCQWVGPEGGGWTIAKRLLQHERTMPRPESAGRSASLPDLARRYIGLDGGGALRDPVLRERVAGHLMGVHAFKSTQRRARDEQWAGAAIASMMKLVGSETHMERHDLIAAICGMTSLVYEDPDKSDVDLAAASQWLRSRGNSIEGGTSEIQLDVLAKHILPEEPGTSPAGCVDAQLSDELDLWARSFAELRCWVVVFVWWRG